jgi:hypothetical protein
MFDIILSRLTVRKIQNAEGKGRGKKRKPVCNELDRGLNALTQKGADFLKVT